MTISVIIRTIYWVAKSGRRVGAAGSAVSDAVGGAIIGGPIGAAIGASVSLSIWGIGELVGYTVRSN